MASGNDYTDYSMQIKPEEKGFGPFWTTFFVIICIIGCIFCGFVCYYNYKVHYTKKVPHEMPEQCPECIFPKPSFKENLEEDKQREIEKMKKNLCTIHKNG